MKARRNFQKNLVRDSLEVGKEGKSWQEFVTFSLEELENNLESQFTEGMNWEVFLTGKIHIDHYYPTNLFRFKSVYDYEFKLCWDLSNLRPMWEIDNLTKNDSLPEDGRSAKTLTEEKRVEYLIKMKLVPENYVYKEESPKSENLGDSNVSLQTMPKQVQDSLELVEFL